MIDYLVEIIFKNVSLEKIGLLLQDLSSRGDDVIDYNLTCDSREIDWKLENSLTDVFAKQAFFGLFVNLKSLKRDGIRLPNCGLAVYKYATEINLEINFQLSDLKNFPAKDLTPALMKLAKSIAVDYGIDEYFGGLEPANDVETRLFTNDQAGPFSFKF